MSPDRGANDDNEFPRNLETIGKGDAAYGDKGSTWTKMHTVRSDFAVFNANAKI